MTPPGRPAGERKADRLARDLMGRIVAGEIAVGSLLPREDELAVAHGVNRGVVREAIKLLEVHRLVRPIRRRGTEVLSPLASLSPEVLRAMLSPRPGRIEARVLGGFLEVRAALDVLMTGLAAERRSDEDLARLEAWLAELSALQAGPVDARSYALSVDRLAHLLARATGNPVFEMLAAWNELVIRDLEPVFRTTRPATRAHLDAVTLLVERVRLRDSAGARALVEAFHAWATPRLLAAAALSDGGSFQEMMEDLAWTPSPAPKPAPRSRRSPSPPRAPAPPRPKPATSAPPRTSARTGSTSSGSKAASTRWGASTGRSSRR